MSEKKTAMMIFKNDAMTERFQASLSSVLPKHITPDRMTKVALSQLRKNPKLANCTMESFANSMVKCSEVGLEPDGEMAHLIPYGQECTLIIDYKGYVNLIRRSGEVDVVKAFTVKSEDVFLWENGKITHTIDILKPRGETVAVYTYLKYSSGAEEYGEPMTRDEVEAVRKRSKAGKAGPWVTDWDEMAKKTAIRRDRKMWPRSSELQKALEADFDRRDPSVKDITDDIDVDARALAIAEEAETDEDPAGGLAEHEEASR